MEKILTAEPLNYLSSLPRGGVCYITSTKPERLKQIDTPFYCDYGRHIFMGSQVIIGMNCTFVDKDIPPGSLAVGNPCKVIQKV